MARLSLPVSSTPQVDIEVVGGNLEVKGWDENEVFVKADDQDHPGLEGNADSVRLSCDGDALVRLPHSARVKVGVVHGGARLKMLDGSLAIDTVHGSLDLRDVGGIQLGQVHGNFLVRQAANGLHAQVIQGNVVVRDLQGRCSLLQVHGNADLRDVEGDIELNASGNARIRLSLLEGTNHAISADGNLHCRFPDDISAQVYLSSGAQNILVHTPAQRQNLRQSEYELCLGEGECSVRLMAGGSISFALKEEDWSDEELHGEMEDAFEGIGEEFGQQLADQIESQIETQMEILDQQMANLDAVIGRAGLSGEQAERIMQQARSASARANERAQEKMRRAQEKLERKLSAAQLKVEARTRAAERRSHEHRRRSWGFEWTSPPPPTKPIVSDEERLMILRMLEEKKISIDQAEVLLSALENSSGS